MAPNFSKHEKKKKRKKKLARECNDHTP